MKIDVDDFPISKFKESQLHLYLQKVDTFFLQVT